MRLLFRQCRRIVVPGVGFAGRFAHTAALTCSMESVLSFDRELAPAKPTASPLVPKGPYTSYGYGWIRTVPSGDGGRGGLRLAAC
jgi:hypothetical protein